MENYYLMGSVWDDEKILEIDRYLMPLCALKNS
jgi:hypothetical protein